MSLVQDVATSQGLCFPECCGSNRGDHRKITRWVLRCSVPLRANMQAQCIAQCASRGFARGTQAQGAVPAVPVPARHSAVPAVPVPARHSAVPAMPVSPFNWSGSKVRQELQLRIVADRCIGPKPSPYTHYCSTVCWCACYAQDSPWPEVPYMPGAYI